MGFNNVGQFVDAELNGQTSIYTWRKQPTQATGAGIWFDLSMSPGNPVPNYYAASPNIAITLKQSTDGGIYHGPAAPAGMKTYLKMLMALTPTAAAVPLQMILCDYLMFYPFVDMSITDPQYMDNTKASLTRSVTGAGVQIMAVEVAGQSGVGNPQFYVTYTDSNGVSGRQTANAVCNTQVVNGTIITSSAATNGNTGVFLTLQTGDAGVRSIEQVTFLTPDVGLIAFVLVKPIENHTIRTIDAPAERVPFMDFPDMPVIEDDAYLNLVVCPQGTLSAAPIHGLLQTVWG